MVARRGATAERLDIARRVLLAFAVVGWKVGRVPLPALVATLSEERRRRHRHYPPGRLARAVDRVLRFGPYQPRCLISALVLYRILRDQGDAAELVIGLPTEPQSKDAHAWVEIDGVDVGPAPGRLGHTAMARFRP